MKATVRFIITAVLLIPFSLLALLIWIVSMFESVFDWAFEDDSYKTPAPWK